MSFVMKSLDFLGNLIKDVFIQPFTSSTLPDDSTDSTIAGMVIFHDDGAGNITIKKGVNTSGVYSWQSIFPNFNQVISPTIIDAKGDLIVGTANDTLTRLAIGTNNQILVADSTQTSGIKWSGLTQGDGIIISGLTITNNGITGVTFYGNSGAYSLGNLNGKVLNLYKILSTSGSFNFTLSSAGLNIEPNSPLITQERTTNVVLNNLIINVDNGNETLFNIQLGNSDTFNLQNVVENIWFTFIINATQQINVTLPNGGYAAAKSWSIAAGKIRIFRLLRSNSINEWEVSEEKIQV